MENNVVYSTCVVLLLKHIGTSGKVALGKLKHNGTARKVGTRRVDKYEYLRKIMYLPLNGINFH